MRDNIISWVKSLFVILGILSVIGIFILVDSYGKSKDIIHYYDSEEITKGMGSVYVEIMSFEPEYLVDEQTLDRRSNQIMKSSKYVICKCVTVGGNVLWVKMRANNYTGYIERYAKSDPSGKEVIEEDNSYYSNCYFTEPICITDGYMIPSARVHNDLEEAIGDTLILSTSGKKEYMYPSWEIKD